MQQKLHNIASSNKTIDMYSPHVPAHNSTKNYCKRNDHSL